MNTPITAQNKLKQQVLNAASAKATEALKTLSTRIKLHFDVLGYENIHVKVENRATNNPAIRINSARLFVEEFGKNSIQGQGPVSSLLRALDAEPSENAP
ncbi:MAG: hypothetical protein COA52_03430 [Hyphomicrobiales bacterium]|nr:hypothetical protein [Hyphomicrobiales bacterium]PCJ95686.1 MAG: hypothetical protein COA52_03430 [Hyphomicrobiales bacterium]